MTAIPPRLEETIPILSERPHLVAFTLPWQVKPPQDSLTVIVKGTFDLVPDGVATPAEEALPPDGDQHAGEPETSGLVYGSDFAIFKPRCDVMLRGSAFPATRGATAVRVVMRLGSQIARVVDVIGDRRWDRGGAMTVPQPFEEIPLVWERAFGGPGFDRNPVGRGVRLDEAVALPNLEDPLQRLQSPGDRPPPAGFGPIAGTWPPRSKMLGHYDDRWVKTRWPYFADDFDWNYFNVAPAPQQIAYPQGNESFELAGVHPTMAAIRGHLPGDRMRVFAQKTELAGGGFFEVRMALDTVWFLADEMKLVLVWRGLFDVRDDDAPEIASLFVHPEPIGTDSTLAQAQEAFFAALERQAADEPEPEPEVPPPPSETPELDEARPRVSVPMRRPTMALEAVVALLASGAVLAGSDLTACDLAGVDFSGRDLTGAVFEGANLTGANFRGANLTEAVLSQVDAMGACFADATMTLADLTSSQLAEADFSRADLTNALVEQCFALKAVFAGARGPGAVFSGTMLREARFDRAWMPGSDFTGCVLERASFREAVLDDSRWYDVRADDVDLEAAAMKDFRANAGRFQRARIQRAMADGSMWDRADLTEALFDGTALKEASFARAVLDRASLSLCSAKEARFRRARMVGCKAIRANLMQADFTGADLTGADLRSANLYQCAFWKAKLQATDLTLAHVAGTTLPG
jgi:uncharacterized protein YjbI with pentapeptide repeats